MKIITIILGFQFVFGLAVAFFAYCDIHSSAMGLEHSHRLQRDFAQLRQSPEYREPPEVRGYSFSRLIEERYSLVSQRGRAALLAFGAGLGASLLAGILLWLLGRVGRIQKAHEHTTT
jgi:hypothetical protein